MKVSKNTSIVIEGLIAVVSTITYFALVRPIHKDTWIVWAWLGSLIPICATLLSMVLIGIKKRRYKAELAKLDTYPVWHDIVSYDSTPELVNLPQYDFTEKPDMCVESDDIELKVTGECKDRSNERLPVFHATIYGDAPDVPEQVIDVHLKAIYPEHYSYPLPVEYTLN